VEPAKASVDVELVALGILHPHHVVIEAVGAQGSGTHSIRFGAYEEDGGDRDQNGVAPPPGRYYSKPFYT
jgi:hypothetical protein